MKPSGNIFDGFYQSEMKDKEQESGVKERKANAHSHIRRFVDNTK